MLMSSFGPRWNSLVICAFVVFTILGLYKLGLTPIHLNKSPPPVPSPIYLPTPTPKPQIVENFPAAAMATSPGDIPSIPSFNAPKISPDDLPAPLFIGFTRNWAILQQAVVSYLAAGWPADQIYVVENTGTMFANKENKLTMQNPFYLNYDRLTKVFGVNVITTPTLLTFAQLQNFMMFYSLDNNFQTYFWSHMDVAVLADERYTIADKDDTSTGRYANLFRRAVNRRNEMISWQQGDQNAPADFKESNGKWAVHYFAYDRLTLVNLQAYLDVGGWDPMIGYYLGDCDFYERLRMDGYYMSSNEIGLIADVGTTLDDLSMYFRRVGWPNDDGSFGTEDERGGEGYERLRNMVLDLENYKQNGGPGLRNFWQSQQQGGHGEPFYKDADGFERGLWMMIENGRAVYREKWGHRDCDIRDQNLRPMDAWRVKHDWRD